MLHHSSILIAIVGALEIKTSLMIFNEVSDETQMTRQTAIVSTADNCCMRIIFRLNAHIHSNELNILLPQSQGEKQNRHCRSASE